MDDLIFCKNMLALRRHLGLSQKDFAACLDTSIYNISKIEHGSVPAMLSSEIMIMIHLRFGLLPSERFLENFPCEKAHSKK